VRPGFQHADDLGFLHRQIECLADGRRIGSEDTLPVGMGEHHHRRRALRFVRRDERPSDERLRAEHREEVRRDETAGRAVRVAAPEDVERPVAEFDELIDRLRLRSVVGHFRKRKIRILDARGRLRLPQMHDAVGLGIRQRAQDHTVDDAEDGGVGADAEAQRQHERAGEPRHADQIPDGDADVVGHGSPRRLDPGAAMAAIMPTPGVL
jgi:hypothetical protein